MKTLLILFYFSVLFFPDNNLNYSNDINYYKKDLSKYMKQIDDNVIIKKINSLQENFNNLPVSQKLKEHIKKVCEYYDFDEYIVYNIIYYESRFNPFSDNGLCKGLMQCNKNYYDNYAKTQDKMSVYITENYDVFNPYVNIILGVRCLSDWRRMGTSLGYNKLYDWLAFYNMGWSYRKYGSNGYAEKIINTNLNTYDFSNYDIIG